MYISAEFFSHNKTLTTKLPRDQNGNIINRSSCLRSICYIIKRTGSSALLGNLSFSKGQKQICVFKLSGNRVGPIVVESKMGDAQLNLSAADLDAEFWISAQLWSKTPTYDFNILTIGCILVL